MPPVGRPARPVHSKQRRLLSSEGRGEGQIRDGQSTRGCAR